MKNRIIPDHILAACPQGARVIGLTRGAFTIVDEADYEWLTEWHWGITPPPGNRVFRSMWDKDLKKHRIQYMARAIMQPPEGMWVDHINADRLDNRRCNLRIATPTQNAHNKSISKANKSGYKGVCFNKANGKWRAQLRVNGVMKYLGDFDRIEDAAAAYATASRDLHGEFHRLR